MISKRPSRVIYKGSSTLDLGAIRWGARRFRLVQYRVLNAAFGVHCRARPDAHTGGPWSYLADRSHPYAPTWGLG